MKWKLREYAGNVPTASTPIASCRYPSTRTGEPSLSMRRRIHKPPSASPRMNALSISSKACVDAPRTSASMRIQTTS